MADTAKGEQFSATLTSPAGNEYKISSPIEYYNLLARGYRPADAQAARRAMEQTAEAATAQTEGPADGVHA